MTTRHTRGITSSVDTHVQDALCLTRDFVRHFLHKDFDWCLRLMSDDLMWIGPKKGQYHIGKESFAVDAPAIEVYDCATVTDEEYLPYASSALSYCIVGKFLVISPRASEQILAHWQRCTFLWERVDTQFRLVHLHVSSPVDYVEEGESYPIHAGTETYRYMRSLRRLGSSRNSVSLYDTEGTVHWVHPSQIIYLEANRKRTIVHCMTKEIVVPAVIRDTVEMVGPKIIRVHRSYAVNRDHVVELKGGRLLLDEGTSIAIPAKRIADVRANLS